MVNGAFARAFKAEVQPVEIASALQRELDDRAAIVAQGRTLVPNDFVVELSERDSERPRRVRRSAGRRARRHGARPCRPAALRVRRSGRGRVRAGERPARPVSSAYAAAPRLAHAHAAADLRPARAFRTQSVPRRGPTDHLRDAVPAVAPGHGARPRDGGRPAHRRPRRLAPRPDQHQRRHRGRHRPRVHEQDPCRRAAGRPGGLVDGTEIRLGSTTAVFQRQRDGG